VILIPTPFLDRGVVVVHPRDAAMLEEVCARGEKPVAFAGLQIVASADLAPEPGTGFINSRDWQDAFTYHPTRSDFEIADMIRRARDLSEKLLRPRVAIPIGELP
jgi:hypothetical protein